MKHLFLLLTLLSFSLTALAQQKVTGKVKDSSGEPVIGASVVVKGNNTMGTITDFDGNFMLDVPAKSVLVISYIGYVTQEVPTAGKNSLEIVLKEDTKTLDEVVVIGYGTQRKGDVTSSVASVKADNFVKGAVKDVGQLIQGKVAGLAITNPNGDPTGSTQIRLRGTNTIGGANTAPLVLIDGIPGELGTVAPEDVESVDVLKDGSAAAIYGTRGTNGVILITTKQAKGVDINQVEYNGYVSTSLIAKKLDMLNADEFRTLYPDQDHGADTDWIDEISRTPVSHVHNLSLMGGNSKTNYIANLNYASRQGIMKKSDFESFQGRIEVTHRMFDDKLKLKFGLFGKKNQMESTTSGGSFRGWVYGQATRRNPTDPVRNEDGTWNENVSKFEYENPLALLYEAEGNVKKTQLRYNGNIVYNPIKDLTLSAVFSYIRDNMNRGYGETLNHISALRDGLAGWSSVGAYTKMEKLMELTAQYNKEIGAHKFSVLGGYSYNETDFEELWIDNYGFQDDYFGGWHNIGIGSALKDGKANIGSKKTPTNLIGFFGRATYSFKNRYLLMGALRYEGASQLWGTDNAWGLFPSISVGWRITEEAFMKNQKIFDDLKLRASYGLTGNFRIPNYGAQGEVAYYSYVLGGNSADVVKGAAPKSMPNPELHWEKTAQVNIGFDASLFKNRLTLGLDLYNSNTYDLLLDVPVPMTTGYKTRLENIGKVNNKGVEFNIATNQKMGDFNWSVYFNISKNINEVKELGPGNADIISSGSVSNAYFITRVGEPIGSYYLPVVEGVFKNQEEVDATLHYMDSPTNYGLADTKPGDFKFKDVNGDKVLDISDTDRAIVGNYMPDFTYGFGATLAWKGIDFGIVFQGVQGNEILNLSRRYFYNHEGNMNNYKGALNRWKSEDEPGSGMNVRANRVSKGQNGTTSTWHVEDGSYLRIKNISLGYTLPENWIKKVYLKSARIYCSLQNPFTFTHYEGYNPEVSNRSAVTTNGEDYGVYPLARTTSIGVNLTF